jgi:hypothetical protein
VRGQYGPGEVDGRAVSDIGRKTVSTRSRTQRPTPQFDLSLRTGGGRVSLSTSEPESDSTDV